MPAGRPRKPLGISNEERDLLRALADDPQSGELAVRARIVLDSVQGASSIRVAEKYQVSNATVSKWRERFRQARLSGITEGPELQMRAASA